MGLFRRKKDRDKKDKSSEDHQIDKKDSSGIKVAKKEKTVELKNLYSISKKTLEMNYGDLKNEESPTIGKESEQEEVEKPIESNIEESYQAKEYKTINIDEEYQIYDPPEDKVTTGLVTFDKEILYGGLPKGYSVALKTIDVDEKDLFLIRFLRDGLENAESCLYISDSLSPLIRHAVADFTPILHLIIASMRAKPVSENMVVCESGVTSLNIALSKVLKKAEISRIVVDSLSSMLKNITGGTIREFINNIISKSKEKNATLLLTVDPILLDEKIIREIIEPFDVHLEIKKSSYGTLLSVTKIPGALYDETPLLLDKDVLTLVLTKEVRKVYAPTSEADLEETDAEATYTIEGMAEALKGDSRLIVDDDDIYEKSVEKLPKELLDIAEDKIEIPIKLAVELPKALDNYENMQYLIYEIWERIDGKESIEGIAETLNLDKKILYKVLTFLEEQELIEIKKGCSNKEANIIKDVVRVWEVLGDKSVFDIEFKTGIEKERLTKAIRFLVKRNLISSKKATIAKTDLADKIKSVMPGGTIAPAATTEVKRIESLPLNDRINKRLERLKMRLERTKERKVEEEKEKEDPEEAIVSYIKRGLQEAGIEGTTHSELKEIVGSMKDGIVELTHGIKIEQSRVTMLVNAMLNIIQKIEESQKMIVDRLGSSKELDKQYVQNKEIEDYLKVLKEKHAGDEEELQVFE